MIRALAVFQGGYFFATGLWPLVHMESFLAVTGPKTDLWLVRTVGVLVLAIGGAIFLAGLRKHLTLEVRLLALSSAAGLGAIDVIFVSLDQIAPIYLVDAALEALLMLLWLSAAIWSRRTESAPPRERA